MAKVKAQVSEVKGVMMENIEKFEWQLLVDETENLRSEAQNFETQETQIRRKMRLQNFMIFVVVYIILIIVIILISISVMCGGFKCK